MVAESQNRSVPVGSNRSAAFDVLAGGGEMGARMRAIDWSKTPLGPVSEWPQSLKTCVRIVLTSRQPMFVWWGESLINLYNDAYQSILGGKHPDALAQPAALVWREIWDAIGPRANAALNHNEGTYDEALLLVMERNGYPEETYYTFSYSPVPNDAGGTGGLLCANSDDTQRIIGERQLALLREQAARTIEARTTDVAHVCEQSMLALETNPRDLPFALLYLVNQDARSASLVGASGIDRGHAAAPAFASLDAQAPWSFADSLRSREPRIVALGKEFGALPTGAWQVPPSHAVMLPLTSSASDAAESVLIVGLNPYRKFDGGYASFLTLAARQIEASMASARAFEEEKNRREALAEVDRAKTAFFSNVSHEFRTPLTLMLAPIEDLLAFQSMEPDTRERVELLHRNALRLLRLVNSLLDFSRIEAGRTDAVFEPTDLAAFTVDLASCFRSAIERAGLSLHVDCEHTDERVFVDRTMWEKIVLNLLSNALKFTFEGAISVRMRVVDRAVELEVADTGTGISERELPRLFERFHRVEGARSRSHEGSGIGLALVHELVRMHGGSIAVESREGHGTTFRVTIPRGVEHLQRERVRVETAMTPPRSSDVFVAEALRWSAGADENALPETRPRTSKKRARIVVADDNADMRDYLTRLLREHWDVVSVRDGHDALEAIRRDPPDLVLSDVMMPGLDGFALLRAVRSDAALSRTPFVLLSARAGDEATADGLKAGADDYVVKPFNARELLLRVAARLSAANAAREMDEQRKNLYRHFVAAPFAVAIFRGPELIVELANEVALKAWGRGPEIIGQPFRSALPEFNDQPFPELLTGVFQTGIAFEGRGERVLLPYNADGATETYWNFVYAPLFDHNGIVEGVMLSAFDVTEQIRDRQRIDLARKEAEALAERLNVASKRLEAAQGAGGIGIFDWGLNGDGFAYWSPEVYSLLGIERDSIAPTPESWTERMMPDDREIGWAAFRNASEARERELEVEVRLVQPDETTRWVRVSSLIHYDADGAPVRLIGAIVDIETHKQAAAARARALEEAERVNRAKDEFLSTMSHELRTPLNAMLGWARILRTSNPDSAKLEKGLAVIERNAEAQERLISDLLDVSRIVSGKLRLALQRIEVASVVQSAIDVVRPAADAKRVTLIAQIDRHLGDAVADPDRLQQVVWNLLTNAVRFTPSHGTVTLSAVRKGSSLALVVEDTGAGIPAEHLPFVFERFRQVDSSTTRTHGGLGLGLAIVRYLVEAHGGAVTAESAGLGRGAKFSVDLPIRALAPPGDETQLNEAKPALEPHKTAEQTRCLSGVRILVVDDDDDSLDLLRELLESAGASIRGVRSAAEALEARGPFDMVISDIGMPEIDGYTFMRRLRSRDHGADVPSIALTAYARAEDAARAIKAGYQAHMSKPVDADSLITTVKEWTRRRASSR